MSVLLEIEKLITSLREVNETISGSSAVARVVSDDLKPFKSSWDSVPAKQQNMTNLLSRLKKIDAESQPKDAPTAESVSKLFWHNKINLRNLSLISGKMEYCFILKFN